MPVCCLSLAHLHTIGRSGGRSLLLYVGRSGGTQAAPGRPCQVCPLVICSQTTPPAYRSYLQFLQMLDCTASQNRTTELQQASASTMQYLQALRPAFRRSFSFLPSLKRHLWWQATVTGLSPLQRLCSSKTSSAYTSFLLSHTCMPVSIKFLTPASSQTSCCPVVAQDTSSACPYCSAPNHQINFSGLSCTSFLAPQALGRKAVRRSLSSAT